MGPAAKIGIAVGATFATSAAISAAIEANSDHTSGFRTGFMMPGLLVSVLGAMGAGPEIFGLGVALIATGSIGEIAGREGVRLLSR